MPLNQQAEDYKDAQKVVERAVMSTFPLTSRGDAYSIDVSDLRWNKGGYGAYADVGAQKAAKVRGRTYFTTLVGHAVLKDGQGKVIEDRPDHPIAMFPVLTRLGSYIVKGKERQVTRLLQMRPGVYGGFAPDGSTRVTLNTASHERYVITYVPETGVATLRVGGTGIPIASVLEVMGISSSKFRRSVPRDVFTANTRAASYSRDLLRMRDAVLPPRLREDPDPALAIRSFLASKALDPRVTKQTLGAEHPNITGQLVLDGLRKAMRIAAKKEEPDDLENVKFKRVRSLPDFMRDRLARNARTITRRIQYVLNKALRSAKHPTLTEAFPPAAFSDTIDAFFGTSDMSRYADQSNPLTIVGDAAAITPMSGEGGIRSTYAVKNEVRSVHPSMLGVLDVVASPEGQKVGLSSRLTTSSRIVDGRPQIPLYDARTGKLAYHFADDVVDDVVGFPDQYTNIPRGGSKDAPGKLVPLSRQVKARHGNTVSPVSASSVRWVFADSSNFFSAQSSRVPFAGNNHANRLMMGGKHATQAVNLEHPDQPLVQARMGAGSANRAIGDAVLAKSPAAGTVVRVSKKEVVIDTKGGRIKVPLYDNYPLNSSTYLTETATVSKGDHVKSGQVIARNNFTDKQDLALGKNLLTAYTAYKGTNYEDAVVISEACAKKLTSVHKYEYVLARDSTVKLGRRVFIAAFPDRVIEALPAGDYVDGVIKVGATVKPDQLLIPAVRQSTYHAELDLKRLQRSIGPRWLDVSEVYDHDEPGEVTDVHVGAREVRVYVKTRAPMVVGDKLSNAAGAKGIVGAIIPDGEMYRDKQGHVIDLMISPASVPGRVNTGQMLETALGKAAEKTGKPYIVDSFSAQSSVDAVKAELTRLGVKDTEDLVDPKTGHVIHNVLVGPQNVIKLKHTVDGKVTARNTVGEAYDTNEQPTKGGSASAMRISSLDTFSLLSGGGTAFLKDAFGIKGQNNDDFWLSLQSGQAPVPPKSPMVTEKFLAMLIGAGMDLRQDGDRMISAPLTDKEVHRMSRGEIVSPRALLANSLEPEKGGLFDRSATGGPGGSNWAHIELAVPVVNPLMHKAVSSVLDLATQSDLTRLISGEWSATSSGDLRKDHSGELVGAAAVSAMLGKLDLDTELARSAGVAQHGRGTKRDKAYRRIRYMRALKALDLKPQEAYIQKSLPVVPPKYRPVSVMDDGTLSVADANHGYREVLLINTELRELQALGVNTTLLRPLTQELSKAVQGLSGTTAPVTRGRTFQGFVAQIKGRQSSKTGFFKSKLLSRPQDLSAKSTIIVGPSLHMDHVGIPRAIARKIYRPFVVRRLARMGTKPLDAKKMLDDGDPVADKALQKEMDERPVLVSRAPSLHKFSIQAQWGKLIDGKAIMVNPLIMPGLGADVDGNCFTKDTIVTLRVERGHATVTPDVEWSTSALRSYLTMKFTSTTEITCLTDEHVTFRTEIGSVPYTESTGVTMADGSTSYELEVPLHTLSYDHKTGSSTFEKVTHFIVDGVHDVARVTTHDGHVVDASDNESICTLNPDTFLLQKSTPDDSLGLFVPVVRKQPAAGVVGDFDFGWCLGAFLGDGSITKNRRQAQYTKNDPALRERYRAVFLSPAFWATAEELAGETVRSMHVRQGKSNIEGPTPGKFGKSHQLRFGLSAAAHAFLQAMYIPGVPGRAALAKHLPTEWFGRLSYDAMCGVLSGLLDADATVSAVDKTVSATLTTAARTRRFFCARLDTSSAGLRDTITSLCRVLGIRVSVGTSMPKPGRSQTNVAYVCALSVNHLREFSGRISLYRQGAQAVIEELRKTPIVNSASRDRMPVPHGLLPLLRVAAKAGGFTPSLQTAISQHMPAIWASRPVAQKWYAALADVTMSEEERGLYTQWCALLSSETMGWSTVTEVEKRDPEPVFDMVIPTTRIFAVNDGIVVYDTVMLHVPVSEEARVEAIDRLMLSKNMFSPADGHVVPLPAKDTLLGIYLATKPVGDPVAVGAKDALRKYRKHELKVNSALKIGGRTRTVGQLLLEGLLPKSAGYDGMVADARAVRKALERVAREENSKKAGDVISAVTALGNKLVTEVGYSVGLDDLIVDRKARDKIVARAKVKAKVVGFRVAAEDAQKEIALLVSSALGNRFVEASLTSGAIGKGGQLAQMIGTPVAVEDIKGDVVPMIIDKSYAEGLDIGTYLATTPGARKGMIDKGLSVADTGYASRLGVTSAVATRITEKDCGTTQSIELPLDDGSLLGRMGATGTERNHPVTASTVDQLRRQGKRTMSVRSPITCESVLGLCAMCYGLREDGTTPKVGFHIGALAGQTIGEKGTQHVLKSFHTGGAVGGKKLGFARAMEILAMPENIQGKATLATVGGIVGPFQRGPSGGSIVSVGDTPHFVPAGAALRVRSGAHVSPGDPLTYGSIKPQELLETTGDMSRVRNYMLGELHDSYNGDINRRIFETAIKPLTDKVRVTEPGGAAELHGLAVGDVLNGNRVTAMRADPRMDGMTPIKSEPILAGIKKSPQYGDDFIALLAHQGLSETIQRAAATGMASQLRGGHPLTELAMSNFQNIRQIKGV